MKLLRRLHDRALRIVCWWNDEHLIVSRIELIGERYEHTYDYCRRCRWRAYTLKGYWQEAYRNGPPEFSELYDAMPKLSSCLFSGARSRSNVAVSHRAGNQIRGMSPRRPSEQEK